MNSTLIDTRCENCYKHLAGLCPGEYPAMSDLECWQSAEDGMEDMMEMEFDKKMNEHAKIIEHCRGCGHISENTCLIYLDPAAKWRNKDKGINCPMCTTVVRGKATAKGKQRIGQQKQKKK